MSIKVINTPALEPISLTEAKEHLRVDHNFDDALISELIKAAREIAEQHTSRPLITQTQILYTDDLIGVIELKPNLQSVTAVRYIDESGTQQTLAQSEYSVSTSDVIGTVFESVDKSWPSVKSGKNAVEIEFICGYGMPDDVPSPIKIAIKMMIAHWYENREATTVGVSTTETPMAVDLLLNPYRVLCV